MANCNRSWGSRLSALGSRHGIRKRAWAAAPPFGARTASGDRRQMRKIERALPRAARFRIRAESRGPRAEDRQPSVALRRYIRPILALVLATFTHLTARHPAVRSGEDHPGEAAGGPLPAAPPLRPPRGDQRAVPRRPSPQPDRCARAVAGDHDTLLAGMGLYYAMWRQQVGERKVSPATAAVG